MKSPDDHLLWFKEKRREGAEDRASFQNFSFNFDSASGIIYTVDVTKPQGEKYANIVPTKQFRSANALPRELGLYEQDGEFYATGFRLSQII